MGGDMKLWTHLRAVSKQRLARMCKTNVCGREIHLNVNEVSTDINTDTFNALLWCELVLQVRMFRHWFEVSVNSLLQLWWYISTTSTIQSSEDTECIRLTEHRTEPEQWDPASSTILERLCRRDHSSVAHCAR